MWKVWNVHLILSRSRVFTKTLTTWKHRFARSKKRLIRDFTVSTAHLWNIDSKFQHGILNRCANQTFFNYFHSTLFFLILAHVYLTFRYHNVTIMECLIKYSNHYFLFSNILPTLLSTCILGIMVEILYFVLRCYYWKKCFRC